ncbi:uncharacterized protein LOC123523436 [Mercenaria mercenaria]|uniref:uncharacterized protein LOC123523436 n=1 Tax=Mercenaria mercenaria TaxID=6596 RepID=UPI00234E7BB1|nr:uncharacterized protein LOC123523436 [Mercenaria mercenaria]
MGTCLGKHRKKRNSVCPSGTKEDLRKNSTRRKAPEDMIQELEDANAEDSKIATAGVSFTVDFWDGDPTRMPSRLADRLDGAITPPEDDNEVKYTSEERQLLAELLRNDVLREKKEKAAKHHGVRF